MKTTRRSFLGTGLSTAMLIAFASVTIQAAEVREELHETYPLKSNGVIKLDNVNGDIRIVAWDRDEVKLDAIKTAKKQEHLDTVKIEVTANADQIQVRTKYPDDKRNTKQGKNNSTSVAYTLTVPKRAELKKISAVNGSIIIDGITGNIEAESVNGRVEASGAQGELDLSSVNGAISAKVDPSPKTNPAKLKSVNGRISLTLPADANADVEVESLNGEIQTDFNLALKKHWPIGRDLKGKLGSGDANIDIETVNGGVEIRQLKIKQNATR